MRYSTPLGHFFYAQNFYFRRVPGIFTLLLLHKGMSESVSKGQNGDILSRSIEKLQNILGGFRMEIKISVESTTLISFTNKKKIFTL